MKLELNDKEARFLVRALVDNYAENEEDFDSKLLRPSSEGGMSSRLIGKVVSASFNSGSKLYDVFTNARHDKWSENKPLNKKLFMGAGHHSLVDVNKLHRRFEFAVGQLGGMQQNGGMGTEFDEELDKQGTQDIKDVLKDFLFAFGMTPEDLK